MAIPAEVEDVVILGAGFAGLELATRLSKSFAAEPGKLRVTLIDQKAAFAFGYSKLDVMFGRKATREILVPYDEISKEGVEFRRERVVSIEPGARHVTTDKRAYEADFLVVALGADYDFAATPGFEEGGFEYYSLAGAERLRGVLPEFESGTILIGILGHPYKCPPAPFEGALLLHDQLVQRGIRDAAEIRVVGPMAKPVPITEEVSQSILDAIGARGIEYVPNRLITAIDPRGKTAWLESGGSIPYNLFIGVPVHRVPEVVEASGLAVDGWIPVDPANLSTRFENVYAVGDVAGTGVPKAGVFAESAAAVVADDIVARLRDGEPPRPWEGSGDCYIEYGGEKVANIQANFLAGPAPAALIVGPSREIAAQKEAFGKTRRERWFGRSL